MNTKEYDAFVDEVWNGKKTGNEDYDYLKNLFIMTTGIGGESGEVEEKLKKYVRDGFIDEKSLIKELGDVLYYTTKIAHTFGFTLDDIIQTNVDKLKGRVKRGTMHGSGDDR